MPSRPTKANILDFVRSPAVAYVASVALTRGFSLITIPVYARCLSPAEFAELEILASLLEFVGLIAAMGLVETMFRFAGAAGREHERRTIAAGLLAVGLIAAGAMICGALAWGALPGTFLGLSLAPEAVRAGLIAAALSGIISLPLAWMRLCDRPILFMKFTVARGTAQAAAVISMLASGAGANGVLIGNFAVELVAATVLVVWQWRSTGISFDRGAVKNNLSYGAPLVGAALAMYAIGNLDRLFLAGQANSADIANYALALKLALAAPLLLQPFALWWMPRRSAWLDQADGLERTASAIGGGFALLTLSCVFVCFAGFAFVALALPDSYAGSAIYLPWVVLLCALNEFSGFVSTAVYQSRFGFGALAINVIGALVAVLGYAILIAPYGVMGAVVATIIAQSARIALFVGAGRRIAAIPYAYGRMTVLALLAFGLVWACPTAASVWAISLQGVLALVACGLCSYAIGLCPKPAILRLAVRASS
jgi:O-antigen/teichoic acid export membrane protein